MDFGSGHADGSTSATTAEAAAFEVTPQDLEVEFDDTEVTDEDDDVTVNVDSRRASYDINVSADGDLDTDELKDIFANSDNTGSFDSVSASETYEDDDTITLSGVSDGDYSTNFSGVDTGEYTFDFEVTDTEASSSASVNVSEAGEGDVAFENDVPQDQIGDVTNVTVQMENTDDATVTIGSEDQNYWVVAQVTDDDDDGEVTVAFNSYLAGSDAADSDVLTDATGEDDVTVLPGRAVLHRQPRRCARSEPPRCNRVRDERLDGPQRHWLGRLARC